MEQEWISWNKIILEFMGDVRITSGARIAYTTLQYHASWDWLMPVWNKFKKLKFKSMTTSLEHIKIKSSISDSIVQGKIENAFVELVTGIRWYNSYNQHSTTQLEDYEKAVRDLADKNDKLEFPN